MSIFDRLWGGGRKTAPQPPATTPAALSVEGPESSATVIAALRKVLRSAGYNTSEALSAEQGLALIEQDPPDLVFLDIILPGMNGFNALRLIRKNPASQHIPVIMISGNEHATEQFYANRICADDF